MADELDKLKQEIAQLRKEVNTLNAMLGNEESAAADLPEIVCKSLRVVGPDGDLVTIEPHGDSGGGKISLKCAGGDRLEIQGKYPHEAIRMFAAGTSDRLFSIGNGFGKYGQIKLFTVESDAFVEMRVMPKSGYIETYDDKRNLNGRMPAPSGGK